MNALKRLIATAIAALALGGLTAVPASAGCVGWPDVPTPPIGSTR